MHFIFKCPLYKIEREALFSCINGRNEDFVKLEDKMKFMFILASNDGHIIKAAGTYNILLHVLIREIKMGM